MKNIQSELLHFPYGTVSIGKKEEEARLKPINHKYRQTITIHVFRAEIDTVNDTL